jgi:VanZ family protein
MPLATIFGRAGWLSVIAIAALSLVPAEARPETGASPQIEHAFAYAGTAFLLAAGYRRPLLTAAFLLGYAACLEMLQHWVPGRHSLVVHYLASSAGVLLGSSTAWAMDYARRCWN